MRPRGGVCCAGRSTAAWGRAQSNAGGWSTAARIHTNGTGNRPDGRFIALAWAGLAADTRASVARHPRNAEMVHRAPAFRAADGAAGAAHGGIDAPASQYSAQLDRGFEKHTAMGAESVQQPEYGVGKTSARDAGEDSGRPITFVGRTCARPTAATTATNDRTKERRDKFFHGHGIQNESPRHGGHSFCLLPTSQASAGIVSSFFTSPAPSEGSQE